MKEAAEMAGLPKENIVIALEPEAATIYCLSKQLQIDETGLKDNPFMVIDAGGGTIDITVHKPNEDGTLIEVHPPSGGDWGSTNVNKEFIRVLEELYGADFLNSIKGTEYWLEVIDSFENIKVKFQDNNKEAPWRNCTVATLGGNPEIANITSYQNIQLINGTLRIPSAVLRQFYKNSLDKTAQHVKDLLAIPACKSLKHIILVGGFAESPLLLKAIINKIGNNVIVLSPPRPSTSVLIGAVKYGFDQNVISSRIALRTIGIEINQYWNEEIHRGRRSMIGDDGIKRRTEIFSTFIRVNEPIKSNHEVKHTYIPASRFNNQVSFQVLSSIKANTPFSTDPGVKFIGTLILNLPESSLPLSAKVMEVSMKFGGTVFSVTATYVRTGESINGQFSFLLGITLFIDNFSYSNSN